MRRYNHGSQATDVVQAILRSSAGQAGRKADTWCPFKSLLVACCSCVQSALVCLSCSMLICVQMQALELLLQAPDSPPHLQQECLTFPLDVYKPKVLGCWYLSDMNCAVEGLA